MAAGGRNAIKHPCVIVNTKGTMGTGKKGDCYGGNSMDPSPRPTLGSGRDSQGDFMGSSVPKQGPVGQEALQGPAMSVMNTDMSAWDEIFPPFIWKHLEEVYKIHHLKRRYTYSYSFLI